MADPQILYMPMGLGLKLMTVVRPNSMNPESEFRNHIVDETDRIFLGMSRIDLESSDTGRIIHSGILKAANLLPVSTHEIEKFYIHLDLTARNLFFVSLGEHSPCFGIPRETIHPIAFENPDKPLQRIP